MIKEKLSKIGHSQADCVPIPYWVEYRESKTSLYSNRVELETFESSWNSLVNSLEKFSDDFMIDGREQPTAHE